METYFTRYYDIGWSASVSASWGTPHKWLLFFGIMMTNQWIKWASLFFRQTRINVCSFEAFGIFFFVSKQMATQFQIVWVPDLVPPYISKRLKHSGNPDLILWRPLQGELVKRRLEDKLIYGGFHSHGGTLKWMVFGRENPIKMI